MAIWAPGWPAVTLDAFAGDRDNDPQDQDQAEEQADVAERVEQRGAAGADRDRHFVASMVGRAVLAFLGAAFGIMSVMLIGVRGGPLLVPAAAGIGTSLFHVFGYAGLFFSLVLILRVIIAITRESI